MSQKKEQQSILVSVDKDNLKHKNYNLKVAVAANKLGWVEGGVRKIPRKEFRNMLQGKDKYGIEKKDALVKFTFRKMKQVIDTFIELDLMAVSDDGKYYYVYPITSNFVKLYGKALDAGMVALSDLGFKVYCYLLSKYEQHNAYNFDQEYMFSVSELLNVCGFHEHSVKARKNMELILESLNSQGFIKSDSLEDAVRKGVDGGPWRRLYEVKRNPDINRKVEKGIRWSSYSFDSFAEYAKAVEERAIEKGVSHDELKHYVIGNLKNREENKGVYEYYENDAEEWLREKNL